MKRNNLLLLLFLISFNCFASFSDKVVDIAFVEKLFQLRKDYLKPVYNLHVESIFAMKELEKDERRLQLFVNFEKKILSWVNYLDASESNEIFSPQMRKWRDENESCSYLILVKELEKEMKKYDEQTQAFYFFLIAFRNNSILSNNAFQYLKAAEVEGTRSYDSGSYLMSRPGSNMNAIARNLTWFSRFIMNLGTSHVKESINEAISSCNRLPSISEIFPNWDMEEVQRMMNIKDREVLKSDMALFMDSSWAPEMNFKYAYRSAMALYPYLEIRFDNRDRSPEFMKVYFDTMVDIYDRSSIVNENLCKALNAPLSLASMLGFDVDPLKKEYSLFSKEDFVKWMEIKASVNVASIRGIKDCMGTLRYIDNVWGGSTILPHPVNSIIHFQESRYLGKNDVKLFYFPKWQSEICMKGSLKGDDENRYVKKSKSNPALGCW